MAKLPRRKCKVCREWFPPAYSNVVWCCPEHGAIYALELRAKEKSKAAARCIRGKHLADKAERQANGCMLREHQAVLYTLSRKMFRKHRSEER
uniref:recombination protein NinG n=2 Tax=Salmonella TaxID=590 RepID=UPI0009AD7910